MYLDALAIFSVLLVAITSTLLFMTSDWRLGVLLLAAQYAGVSLLVSLEWPMAMAIVKLIAGWMSGAVIGIALIGSPELQTGPGAGQEEKAGIDETGVAGAHRTLAGQRAIVGRAFYLLTTLLVGLVVVSQSPRMLSWIPGIRIEQVWGGLLLMGMGLLKLGFTLEPLPATFGLLTALSGFEVIYASIERSTLVAGVLAGITLGLALAGAYLVMTPYLEEGAP